MLERYSGVVWTGCVWFRTGIRRGEGSCESGNEPGCTTGVLLISSVLHIELVSQLVMDEQIEKQTGCLHVHNACTQCTEVGEFLQYLLDKI
jgi:hypothetical protein